MCSAKRRNFAQNAFSTRFLFFSAGRNHANNKIKTVQPMVSCWLHVPDRDQLECAKNSTCMTTYCSCAKLLCTSIVVDSRCAHFPVDSLIRWLEHDGALLSPEPLHKRAYYALKGTVGSNVHCDGLGSSLSR